MTIQDQGAREMYGSQSIYQVVVHFEADGATVRVQVAPGAESGGAVQFQEWKDKRNISVAAAAQMVQKIVEDYGLTDTRLHERESWPPALKHALLQELWNRGVGIGQPCTRCGRFHGTANACAAP